MKKILLRICLCCAMFLTIGGYSALVEGTPVASAHAVSPDHHSINLNDHYLALGDSLAFGYQPDGNFQQGYAADLFTALQKKGVQDLVDLGCNGETSSTFITGPCPYAPAGTPAQLASAVSYLQANAGNVGPITLQIGANDVLTAINVQTCTIDDATFSANLKTLDHNLRATILPQLHTAITAHWHHSVDILMPNYYDPFQNFCPNTVSYIQVLNQHLAADIAGYGRIVDIFTAFGGATIPNPNVCTLTWICSTYTDIHPTTAGYQLIANTIYKKLLAH